MRRFTWLLALVIVCCLVAPSLAKRRFFIDIPAIPENGPIPLKYTGKGEDISPMVVWGNVPSGTRSLVLICRDPDAKNKDWFHWSVAGIAPDTVSLEEGFVREKSLVQGLNDFNEVGYRGPMPPVGKLHHYHFSIIALDNVPLLDNGFTKTQLREAIKGHEIGRATYIGTFIRQD